MIIVKQDVWFMEERVYKRSKEFQETEEKSEKPVEAPIVAQQNQG